MTSTRARSACSPRSGSQVHASQQHQPQTQSQTVPRAAFFCLPQPIYQGTTSLQSQNFFRATPTSSPNTPAKQALDAMPASQPDFNTTQHRQRLATTVTLRLPQLTTKAAQHNATQRTATHGNAVLRQRTTTHGNAALRWLAGWLAARQKLQNARTNAVHERCERTNERTNAVDERTNERTNERCGALTVSEGE